MDRIVKLKEFLQAKPDDSFIQHALALEYVKSGDVGEAKRLFENILTRDENYIGSYYHLAKLLESMNQKENAISWYEKGMVKAKELGDMHAFNELMGAYEDLVY
ncbi:MAG: tetratricopeptide repeat protein [Flavisolibacter sp.]